MTMLEKELEAKLVQSVRARGGLCLKWVCPGTAGVPDRIILLPGGRIAFAELKRPEGARVAPLQKYWRRVLTDLGFRHYMIRNEEDIDAAMSSIAQS